MTGKTQNSHPEPPDAEEEKRLELQKLETNRRLNRDVHSLPDEVWFNVREGFMREVRQLLEIDAVELEVQPGDDERLQRLQIDVRDPKFGWSTLCYAASYGQVELVELLLSLKADPEFVTNSGERPIHFAAKSGRGAAIRILHELANVDVEVEDNRGWTPLIWAAIGGHKDATSALLVARADVNRADKYEGRTPLHWAAQCGKLDVLRILVGQGQADINIKDHKGKLSEDLARQQVHVLGWLAAAEHLQQRLLAAAKKSDLAELTDIVSHPDLNMDVKGESGITALMWACMSGRLDIVKLLTSSGADPRVLDDAGREACAYAELASPVADVQRTLKDALHSNAFMIGVVTQTQGDEECCIGVRKAMEMGACVGCRDAKGFTSLHWAGFRGYPKLVKMLIEEFNAPINISDYQDWRPLHVVCSSAEPKVEIVEMLLQAKADITAKTSRLTDALHIAIEFGNVIFFPMLVSALDKKMDHAFWEAKQNRSELPNEEVAAHSEIQNHHPYGKGLERLDFRGLTPLCAAVSSGRRHCVEWLLEAKANPAVFDADENNILAMAICKNSHSHDNFDKSCLGVVDMLQSLLSEGQLENMSKEVNLDGQTALLKLCSRGRQQPVCASLLRSLVAMKGDICASDDLGWTPLLWSVHSNNVELVDLIAPAAPNEIVRMANDDETSPIRLAAKRGSAFDCVVQTLRGHLPKPELDIGENPAQGETGQSSDNALAGTKSFFGESLVPTSLPAHQHEDRRVVVRNIPPKATDDELDQFISSKMIDVKTCRVVMNPITNHNFGFAYIEVEDAKDFDRIMNLRLKGRTWEHKGPPASTYIITIECARKGWIKPADIRTENDPHPVDWPPNPIDLDEVNPVFLKNTKYAPKIGLQSKVSSLALKASAGPIFLKTNDV